VTAEGLTGFWDEFARGWLSAGESASVVNFMLEREKVRLPLLWWPETTSWSVSKSQASAAAFFLRQL
jgi:hypothetical protein